jgi:putative copper resistance protein D
MAQTALMFDEPAAAARAADVISVLLDTQVGRGLAARLVLALTFLGFLAWQRSDRAIWRGGMLLGALIAASFAWTGHGAATEGPGGYLHLAADIVHLLAAAIWLGALVPLLVLVLRARRATSSADRRLAHDSLDGFSGVGTTAVALLVVTGAINSWFLVGPRNIGALPYNLYGQLLLAKLVLFAAMLAFASANRFWLTPALHRGLATAPEEPLRALRTSILLETAAGLLVLGLVSLLGTLAPVSSL